MCLSTPRLYPKDWKGQIWDIFSNYIPASDSDFSYSTIVSAIAFIQGYSHSPLKRLGKSFSFTMCLTSKSNFEAVKHFMILVAPILQKLTYLLACKAILLKDSVFIPQVVLGLQWQSALEFPSLSDVIRKHATMWLCHLAVTILTVPGCHHNPRTTWVVKWGLPYRKRQESQASKLAGEAFIWELWTNGYVSWAGTTECRLVGKCHRQALQSSSG